MRSKIDFKSARKAFRSTGDPETTPPYDSTAAVNEQTQTRRRLQYSMVARLVVASLLLGGALFVAVNEETGFRSFTPVALILLIVIMYASTLAFALGLLRWHRTDLIALGQIALDLTITTVLLFLSGGLNSGFTFLYGVTVLMTAMVMGPAEARIAGLSASVLYLGVGIGLARGWIPVAPDQSSEAYALEISEIVRASSTSIFGLLLVTLLASGLATRLRVTGGQLKAAKASAARLARINNDIVRSLGSGLLTTNLHGEIQTINPTGVEMFHCTEQEIVGKTLDSILSGTTQGLGNVTRAEGFALRPDGSSFPVGFSTNALQNEEGIDIGTVVVFQDLTEIVQLRDAAHRADRLATLGRLSAGLAHEIRNPLNSISSSVELVRDSPRLDQQERRLLSVILKESERLNELVTTMLQVGRPVSPQFQRLALGQIVEEVIEMARQNPGSNTQINIEASLPQEPVSAWIDGGQIKQVLWNLIKNAIQASPQGAQVRVKLRNDREGRALIEVSDEGMGIDPKKTERIFDMFHTERIHGAGIGLALVKQIVDAHRGSIEVQSALEKGATFRVSLPADTPNSKNP
ncbi:MAG: hypothetical protein JXA30_14525 [Deltaproteobacteria bacterium]|nr:hypothetical protein [Deltaproteobacteria bacterium]